MKTRIVSIIILLLGLVLTAINLAPSIIAQTEQNPSAGVSTAFTYQGILTDGNSPANGTYDLQFRLYDAGTGGNQIGTVVASNDQAVSDGLLAVVLDFGENVFSGSSRYLEIRVRPGSSSGSYETLAERQPLTASPYAIHAGTANALATEMLPPTGVIATATSGGSLSQGIYYFKIVASDGVGTSIGSSEVSCTVNGSSTNRCALSWNAVAGTASYRIYKGASSNGQNLYKTAATNSYNYDTDSGSTAGAVPTTVTAFVNSLNASGNSWLLGGNLGIGTTNPEASLHLAGDRTTLYGPNSGWGGYLQIGGTGYSSARATISTSDGTLYIDDRDSASGTFINFYSQNNILLNAQGGNVGIGTISPSAKLDVAGNIDFTGQKACGVHNPSQYRFVTLVPTSWTVSTCASYATTHGPDFYLVCIFENSFSIGADGGAIPAPNCGW